MELTSQIAYVRAAGTATHLDGARIWQAGPFYDLPYAEIAAPFETARTRIPVAAASR